jgi:hypothetical protein
MTEAQLNARRKNAQLSTGPRTIEGKKRSSLNAVRHGLTGQIIVHTLEDHAHELQLLATYENRIRRSVEKNTAELRTLQAKRKFAPIEPQLEHFLTARFEGGNDDR